jgi:hypothetical protein
MASCSSVHLSASASCVYQNSLCDYCWNLSSLSLRGHCILVRLNSSKHSQEDAMAIRRWLKEAAKLRSSSARATFKTYFQRPNRHYIKVWTAGVMACNYQSRNFDPVLPIQHYLSCNSRSKWNYFVPRSTCSVPVYKRTSCASYACTVGFRGAAASDVPGWGTR